MKYKLPIKLARRKNTHIKQVYFRIPEDMITQFNETLINSTLKPQDLVEDMVRHCLNDLGENGIIQLSAGATESKGA